MAFGLAAADEAPPVTAVTAAVPESAAERYFGKVSRSFNLGQDIDDGAATAKFTDGVLELTLPKKAQAQAKRLTID
jgi:HSP20 family molecular chaperone IbpA